MIAARADRKTPIVSSARFHLTRKLEIESNTWIGHEVLLVGGDADVLIGKDVDIAPRVSLIAGTHRSFTLPGKAAGEGYSLPITIEDGAWIGAASTILGGVTLGEQSIIAAGALVRTSIRKREMMAGVPAAPVKKIHCHQ